MTAAEVQNHPEYPHITWDLKPREKGALDVAEGRGGPFKLAWEIHGDGPEKIVVSGVWCLCPVAFVLFFLCFSPSLSFPFCWYYQKGRERRKKDIPRTQIHAKQE